MTAGQWAENVGVQGPPEPQGYVAVDGLDIVGRQGYVCPDCGAIWNADELHEDGCSRVTAPTERYCMAPEHLASNEGDAVRMEPTCGVALTGPCVPAVLVPVTQREAEQRVIEAANDVEVIDLGEQGIAVVGAQKLSDALAALAAVQGIPVDTEATE